MKFLKGLIVTVLLIAFLFSMGTIALTLYEYRVSEQSYADAAERFVLAAEPAGPAVQEGEEETPSDAGVSAAIPKKPHKIELAPFAVDFDALLEVNPEVTGWLYCEDTQINYPVLQGEDNDLYLHHLYDKSYCFGGSLFVEAMNKRDFQDYNTIIYGHNMRNGSMFGGLDKWKKQDYYEEHPVLWLLTPERDYRIEILAAYTTDAYSDAYVIIDGEGDVLDSYLQAALDSSLIECQAQPEAGSRYVLLSTCSYAFDNARFVIHGRLVPVDSAGGAYKELP